MSKNISYGISFFVMISLFLTFCGGCGQKKAPVAESEQPIAREQREIKQPADTVLPNGTYRFDIAFAEWQGKSIDEKVTVIINGDSIQVIYEGDGQLGEKGKLENGKIMKHKSGVWIISNDPSDIQLDEVGGCTGGPSIIDFKNKKYEMC